MKHISPLTVRNATLSVTLVTFMIGCSINAEEAGTAASFDERSPDALESMARITPSATLALREALYQRVRSHTSIGYRAARRKLLAGFGGYNGRVECMYTGATASTNDLNIEHSWPQSRGASSEPARSDLHHLFVTVVAANSRRASYPFGKTNCGAEANANANACRWAQGGSSLGDDTGSATRVFEVRQARRGDIARAQFYFAVRYQKAIADTEEEILRLWNTQDPVDADERERNDSVESVQNNRNPFIDAPELVDQIDNF